MTKSQEARFWAKVQKTGKCWNWTAAVHPKGYGLFCVPRARGRPRRSHPAHRVAYRLVKGPINEQLHHTCQNKRCVNPDHLVDLTAAEHALEHPKLRPTHCKHGHEFTPENTYCPPKRPHHRHCVECQRERVRRSRA